MRSGSRHLLQRGWTQRAGLVAMRCLPCGCSSPFKGDPPLPREQSGWQRDRTNTTIPTERELDEGEDAFDDGFGDGS